MSTMCLIKIVELATAMQRGVHLNRSRLDLMHNGGGIDVAFLLHMPKSPHCPLDLLLDTKCTHLQLPAACLFKTSQEKLLTKATPLHSSVYPSTVVTAWIGVKRPITTTPGFQVSTVSWWSKSLKFLLLSSFHPTFTSLSATAQGFFETSKPGLMQNS